jgi:hypothetical protein
LVGWFCGSKWAKITKKTTKNIEEIYSFQMPDFLFRVQDPYSDPELDLHQISNADS